MHRQGGFLEGGCQGRLNGKLLHEVLDTQPFYPLAGAQAVIAHWLCRYSHILPHQSLGYRPPVPETVAPGLQTLDITKRLTSCMPDTYMFSVNQYKRRVTSQ